MDTSNMDSNITNTPTDSQTMTTLDDAFNSLAASYNENGAFSTMDEPQLAGAPTQDIADNNDTSDDNSEPAPTQEPQPQTSEPTASGISEPATPAIPESQPMPTVDYNKLLMDKDSQIELWKTRLYELSSQYQELKNQATTTSSESKTQMSSSKPASDSPAIKELFEYYPEIAQAVTEMIESKSSAIEQSVKEQVEPVVASTRQKAAQDFYTKIKSVHPDIDQIVSSQVLRSWADTLDPVAKAGANSIMQFGNADEIISLVNQYKASLKPSTAPTPAQAAPTTAPKTQTSDSQELVNKVLAAMAVASPDQTATLTKQVAVPTYTNEIDAFNALAKEYEKDHNSLHRW